MLEINRLACSKDKTMLKTESIASTAISDCTVYGSNPFRYVIGCMKILITADLHYREH